MSDAMAQTGSSVTSISSLNWETDVPVATHPLMLVNFAKVIAIAAALMCGLLAFVLAMNGETAAIWPLVAMLFAVSAGLFLLILVIALVFYRNRMPMRFTVDTKGASASVIDRRTQTVSKVAIVMGLLTGKPGVAGAGMISAGTLNRAILWKAIAHADFHPRWHAVSLANSWRTVLILFCRDDNYEAVATAVRAALAARPVARGATKNPLPGLLLRSVLAVIATLPLFRLPDNLEVGSFAPFIVLCFALATVWLVPLLAWVVIAALIYIAGAGLLNGFALMLSLFGEGLANPALRGDDWAELAVAAIGAGYLMWHSIATLRGRVRSALMSD